MAEKFWNLANLIDLRSRENPTQGKPKEIHAQTHDNQTCEN